MTSDSTTACLPQSETDTAEHVFDNWFDPIEAGLRDRAREFLQAMLEAELEEVQGRSRYGRRREPSDGASEDAAGITGHRHGHRSRSLLGTFGRVKIAVPRARLNTADGKTTEWKSRMLRWPADCLWLLTPYNSREEAQKGSDQCSRDCRGRGKPSRLSSQPLSPP